MCAFGLGPPGMEGHYYVHRTRLVFPIHRPLREALRRVCPGLGPKHQHVGLKGCRPGHEVTRCTEAGAYAWDFVSTVVQVLQATLGGPGFELHRAGGQEAGGEEEQSSPHQGEGREAGGEEEQPHPPHAGGHEIRGEEEAPSSGYDPEEAINTPDEAEGGDKDERAPSRDQAEEESSSSEQGEEEPEDDDVIVTVPAQEDEVMVDVSPANTQVSWDPEDVDEEDNQAKRRRLAVQGAICAGILFCPDLLKDPVPRGLGRLALTNMPGGCV